MVRAIVAFLRARYAFSARVARACSDEARRRVSMRRSIVPLDLRRACVCAVGSRGWSLGILAFGVPRGPGGWDRVRDFDDGDELQFMVWICEGYRIPGFASTEETEW